MAYKVVKLPDADYAGMHPDRWPAPRHVDMEMFTRMQTNLQRMQHLSRHEKAVWHRALHYLLEDVEETDLYRTSSEELLRLELKAQQEDDERTAKKIRGKWLEVTWLRGHFQYQWGKNEVSRETAIGVLASQ